jgi:replicative DNA helicase
VSQLIDTTLARQFDRLPPHSLDAERALLASLMRLQGDNVRWAKVRALVGEESFFQADHQIIFGAIDRIVASGAEADPTAVRAALVARQVLDEIGGQVYLAEIYLSAPHAANAVEYAKTVREMAMRRALIAEANDTLRRAYGPLDDDGGAETLAHGLASRAARIAATGRPCDVYRLGDVAAEVFEAKMQGKQARIPTGIQELDGMIGGLRIGGKTIIGAKPGMGKSVLLKQIGLNLSRRGVKFGVVSIEESREKIAENALANQSGVANNRISFGQLTHDDSGRFAQAVHDVSALPFFIVDSARRLSSIVAAARLLHYEYGCEVVAVDHLHIIDPEAVNRESREREISKISAELKWVWKDLNIAGIEAAQLNRASGQDRPTLASLRDSGSLEQDGDVVCLLHREDYYRPGGTPDHVIELIIAKNKDGAPGVAVCHYDGARQRIRDWTAEEKALSAQPQGDEIP